MADKIDKLPKWAQDLIRAERNRSNALEEVVKALQNKLPEEKTDFTYRAAGLGLEIDECLRLPRQATIKIPIYDDPNGDFIEVRRHRGNSIEIRTRDGTLNIKPHVSNTIVVEAV